MVVPWVALQRKKGDHCELFSQPLFLREPGLELIAVLLDRFGSTMRFFDHRSQKDSEVTSFAGCHLLSRLERVNGFSN